jgi:hypothetical protein
VRVDENGLIMTKVLATSAPTIFDFHSVFHNLTAFRTASNPSQTAWILGFLKGFRGELMPQLKSENPAFQIAFQFKLVMPLG